ncbi:hypothetical protein JVT61DRAFT_10914 [Boletus reticuloceps]|uniref:Uncharacterized protein n=1 Tax=Boletus reticuloceps TaxID=495285 RepID=A0A8I3A4K8_9AGAM|nr:hypothetical protein JVT61DRAFT_10914 [Boletus reticuloceps]
MDVDNNIPLIVPHQLYQRLLDMDPGGAYGISYDIYTRKTEDDLPMGWNAPRAATYLELARILGESGFRRLQYSEWVSDNSDATDTYWTMLNLLRLRPVGKLESTLKGLKAHHIPTWELDITEEVRLGGVYSPNLRGPTPVNLVPQNMPVAIPDNMRIPDFTRLSPSTLDLESWRVSL